MPSNRRLTTEKLSPLDIAVRAEDIQTGLQEADVETQFLSYVKETRLIGMAARLGTHLRGRDVVSYQRCQMLAGHLGIDALVLDRVLKVLEESEYVQIVQSGAQQQVTESVPYYGDVYKRLGEVWRARNPGEIEQASIATLDLLASSPLPLADARARLGLDDDSAGIVLGLGEAGGYIARYKSPADDQEIAYSPLFWEEKPEALMEAIHQHGSELIINAINKVRSQQGYALPSLSGPSISKEDAVLVDLMRRGLVPSPSVSSTAGEHTFAFTPYQGHPPIGKEERAVLQKARCLVACVRYGQSFGTITRVKNAGAILGRLKASGRVGPHSEIRQQYALLVVEGVARIEEDRLHRGRHNVVLIDTEENKRAIDLALALLNVGQVLSAHTQDDASRDALFLPGAALEPLRTVARARRRVQFAPAAHQKAIDELIDEVREFTP